MSVPYEDLLVLGDTQVGSIFGIWPEGYVLSDGGTYLPNPGQQYLWACWNHLANRISQTQRGGQTNITGLVFMGDATDGQQFKQGATEAIVTRMADQIGAFLQVMQVVKDVLPRVPIYGIQGCLVPGHRVLTTEMRWIPVEDLQVGQGLLTVSESPSRGGRSWEVGVVTAHVPVRKEVCEITFDDGTRLTCTTDHPLLVYRSSAYTWTRAGNLRTSSRVVKMIEPWERLESYEAGWLAGFLEGEGSTANNGSVGFGQAAKNYRVTSRAVDFLSRLGYETKSAIVKRDGSTACGVPGGWKNSVKLMGEIGADRLIGRFVSSLGKKPYAVGRARANEFKRVVSVKRLGEREIVGLSTSTGTYVAEGFVHHNTEYHDGKAADAFEGAMASLGAVEYSGSGSGKFSHEVLDLVVPGSGVTINFAHHISVLTGLYRAVAIDREAIWSALAGKEGQLPKADVIVRAHVHHFVHVEHASKHGIIVPGWQLQTRFMRRHSVYRMVPDLGAVVIRIWKEESWFDDKIQVFKLRYGLPPIRPHVHQHGGA